MATLEEALSSLDPQIKHKLNLAGDDASLLLYDPSIPAFAQRRLVGSEIHN
ncbi:hypothetical protein SFA35_25195 (plasmid) [Pseudomonas sp. HR96]|uniref:hypothetical protein n=1 Tax=Pseudomonas sp. HR96 TaxID=1027966 RepID=UPI002A75A723|nr:hypothetical protein [Pseudomonas sp. HR96]WPP02466.1 hypothetical protein SFA35_25195 [Pseudomonas sp. HR96]